MIEYRLNRNRGEAMIDYRLDIENRSDLMIEYRKSQLNIYASIVDTNKRFVFIPFFMAAGGRGQKKSSMRTGRGQENPTCVLSDQLTD